MRWSSVIGTLISISSRRRKLFDVTSDDALALGPIHQGRDKARCRLVEQKHAKFTEQQSEAHGLTMALVARELRGNDPL
jgi:hypothetical protein